ncbi:MAG: ADP-ribosylglycohydrolase family protein [Anaerolineae bacterium]
MNGLGWRGDTCEEAIAGCLAGLAVGDALGAPVEWKTAQAIAAEFPHGLRDLVGRADLGLLAGQVTDDTEMALVVARSLVACQCLDMADMAGRLLEWFHQTACTIGSSTRAGIEAIGRGVHWSRSGSTLSPSSGCLPRCAPVAMLLPASRLAQASAQCCRLTHRHPEAIACTVALNLLLSQLIAGARWEDCLNDVSGFGKHWPLGVSLQAAVEALAGERHEAGTAAGVLRDAIRAVQASETAEDAIVAAVMAGGDTDTCGAVAGALAGARWGLASLPRRWLERCNRAEEAVELGRRLAQLRAPASLVGMGSGLGQR